MPSPFLGRTFFRQTALSTSQTDRSRLNIRTLLLCSSAAVGLAGGALPARAELIGLGTMPGYDRNSFAFDVSADGSAVVGYATNAATYAAFRWTAATGMTSIGPAASKPNGISADGSTVAGSLYTVDHSEAFIWTEAGGMQLLGTDGFTDSFGEGISANGAYVVGGLRGAGQTQAFAWTEAGGIESLGYLTGGRPFSIAYDVSDGGIVVGYGQTIIGVQAFYKDLMSPSSLLGLDYLSADSSYSIANAITPDAGTIVGSSDNALGDIFAVRWLANAPGFAPAEKLSGVDVWDYSVANGVSADGKIIVGDFKYDGSTTQYDAFRWVEGEDAESVEAWLTGSGVDTTGWRFEHANAVSDNGETIVGSGKFNSNTDIQAYVARAGVVVGVTDYTQSVASLNEMLRLPAALSLARVGGELPPVDGMAGLSVSAIYDHVSGSSSDLGGGMLTWRQPGFAVTVGGGVSGATSSPLYEGGSVSTRGGWFGLGGTADIGEALDVSELVGLEVGVGLRANLQHAEITRNYLNGASVESATGETDLSSVSTIARLGWQLALSDQVSVTPYAQWRHNATRFDGYDETGGAGAGAVSGASAKTDIVSLGARLDIEVQAGLDLSAGYAFNHRIASEADAVTVSVPGLGGFSAAGAATDASWHTVDAGFGWNPTDKMRIDTSASVNFGSAFPESWAVSTRLGFGL